MHLSKLASGQEIRSSERFIWEKKDHKNVFCENCMDSKAGNGGGHGMDALPLMFAAWRKAEAGPRKPPGTCDIV